MRKDNPTPAYSPVSDRRRLTALCGDGGGDSFDSITLVEGYFLEIRTSIQVGIVYTYI
jgi:hypothetical protein